MRTPFRDTFSVVEEVDMSSICGAIHRPRSFFVANTQRSRQLIGKGRCISSRIGWARQQDETEHIPFLWLDWMHG